MRNTRKINLILIGIVFLILSILSINEYNKKIKREKIKEKIEQEMREAEKTDNYLKQQRKYMELK